MVTRVLLEMCGPTQVSSRTTDQELPDRVMRHPALTHCSSHTQKKPGDIHTLAGCQGGSQGLWRPEKRVTLACIPPAKGLFKQGAGRLFSADQKILDWRVWDTLMTYWYSFNMTSGQLIYLWHTKKTRWYRGQLLREYLEWINTNTFLENKAFLFQDWMCCFYMEWSCMMSISNKWTKLYTDVWSWTSNQSR